MLVVMYSGSLHYMRDMQKRNLLTLTGDILPLGMMFPIFIWRNMMKQHLDLLK